MSYFDKQPSSRVIRTQSIAYGGNTTSAPSTNFGSMTNQVRLVSEVQGWVMFGEGTTSGTTIAAVVASSSVKISANVEGEYFVVSPGMMVAFNSTSTSTGFLNISEMG